MNENTRRLLQWSPRVLCLAFAAFLAVFALDVFDEPFRFPGTLVALLVHLLPTATILMALVVVWRWAWIGAVAFPLLAAYHASLMWGRLHWTGCAAIEGPLVLAGLLFALDAWSRRAGRAAVR